MAAQVSLCLTWSETPEDMFCCVVAHMYKETTGHSRYVDFAYLNTTTYVKVICHSQHFFSIFLCISTPSMLKTINMKQRVSQGDFQALDVFSIIFVTVYVEIKIGARMGAILSASAMYMY